VRRAVGRPARASAEVGPRSISQLRAPQLSSGTNRARRPDCGSVIATIERQVSAA
jgi:hypothetical protein